jgi:GNAT superfamily N-acetyltransferase
VARESNVEATERPLIERYLARERSPQFLAELDEVFFEASGTKTFADEAARLSFRERWLGRYLTHDPELAFLAIAAPGQQEETLAGYLVGALDDPARAPRFADLGYFQNLADVTARYPAQLHVNLAPAWRGAGIGRDLVDAFIADARSAGAPGVHVVTSRGMRNVRFYAQCGFVELGACEWNGRELLMLGRALD